MFARKPAPVQASWLGYFNTTGVAAIDYVLMDEATVPAGAERWFTETVVRLPEGRFCYAPPDYAPTTIGVASNVFVPNPKAGKWIFGETEFTKMFQALFQPVRKLSPRDQELFVGKVGRTPDEVFQPLFRNIG